MLHHPVPVKEDLDLPPLRLMDREMMVTADPVRSLIKLFLQLAEISQKAHLEKDDVFLVPLAQARLALGEVEVLEREDIR